MRAPRNLFFLSLALAVVSVCSVQHNQNAIPKDNVLMHNAIIKGDTETMKLLLDKSSVKLDGLDPGTPEWRRDLPSLYKRSIKAKSPEERAQPEATMQQATSRPPS
jgi:hypothetical protein